MSLKSTIFNTLRYGNRWIRNTFGVYDTEDKIIADAQRFWNDPEKIQEGQYSHFRGSGIFTDDEKWLSIGRENLTIFEEFTRAIQYEGPLDTALEWGCGGGANAVHFAPLYRTFYALDINRECLVECAYQLANQGLPSHELIEIEAGSPEKALEKVPEPLDLFYCLYVIELLPTKAYVERVISIAAEMLRPGGLAFLQFKYTTSDWESQTKRWNYAGNPSNMVSFWPDEFWILCEKHGLKPQVLKLQPWQPLVTDQRYAYVLCVKEWGSGIRI